MIELEQLLPAGEQGWLLLLELADARDRDWLLIGGQMVYVLALEHGTQLPHATVDMDVVVNVRHFQGGTGLARAVARRPRLRARQTEHRRDQPPVPASGP